MPCAREEQRCDHGDGDELAARALAPFHRSPHPCPRSRSRGAGATSPARGRLLLDADRVVALRSGRESSNACHNRRVHWMQRRPPGGAPTPHVLPVRCVYRRGAGAHAPCKPSAGDGAPRTPPSRCGPVPEPVGSRALRRPDAQSGRRHQHLETVARGAVGAKALVGVEGEQPLLKRSARLGLTRCSGKEAPVGIGLNR